jgi:hypothetical protein
MSKLHKVLLGLVGCIVLIVGLNWAVGTEPKRRVAAIEADPLVADLPAGFRRTYLDTDLGGRTNADPDVVVGTGYSFDGDYRAAGTSFRSHATRHGWRACAAPTSSDATTFGYAAAKNLQGFTAFADFYAKDSEAHLVIRAPRKDGGISSC